MNIPPMLQSVYSAFALAKREFADIGLRYIDARKTGTATALDAEFNARFMMQSCMARHLRDEMESVPAECRVAVENEMARVHSERFPV